MARTLTEWLRTRSDAQLELLLRRRPDLALPAPVDLASLASRIAVRASVARAMDGLDAFTLRVLEVLAGLPPTADLAQLRSWFDPAQHTDVDQAFDRLQDWALAWSSTVTDTAPSSEAGGATEFTGLVHAAPAVADVIGPYPAGLGRPALALFTGLSETVLTPLLRRFGLPATAQPGGGRVLTELVLGRLPQLLADSAPDELSVLTALAAGPPVGALRNATNSVATSWAAGSPPPARALVDRGLLVPIDRHAVELPREIALAVREFPAGPSMPRPAELELVQRPDRAVDGSATAAVFETIRLTEALLRAIADDPPSPLRSGGLGVRELRRLAKTLGAGESMTALLLEISYHAGLLAVSKTMEPVFLPSSDFDEWQRLPSAQRWTVIAAAWLSMARLPSVIGGRDERDKVIAALSAEVERHSAPALRMQVLRVLAEVPAGFAVSSPEQLLARLSWQAPRRAAANLTTAADLLAEAATLGLTGSGAITSYTRALIVDQASRKPDAADAAELLTAVLPTPVEHFLLQPDLTAVVPGPPTPQLRAELELTADLESSGGASVYRISPATLRRALDAGRSAADLRQFFATSSKTPVPQALDYLIGDAATQHGRLRAGLATCYLRCEDESLLDRVLAEPSLSTLGLHRVAPTVLVADVPLAQLLDRLRAADLAPAAETAEGALLQLPVTPPRAPARPARAGRTRSDTLGESQLSEVITRLRASERLSQAISRSASRVVQQVPGVTSASILELLRTAIRESSTIALGFVDDTGTPSQQTLQPISLAGGMLRGLQPEDSRLRSYPLQRITAVSLLED